MQKDKDLILKSIADKLKPRYITLYLLILFSVGGGSTFALYKNFMTFEQQVKSELLREANITNVLIESILIDSSSLLNIVAPRIVDGLSSGKITDQEAFKILQSSRAQLNFLIEREGFLLTLYIDEQGMLRATSREVYKSPINLSDRLYFLKLKNDPKKKVAVGNLVIARTTGLLTFHVSVPIVDKNGNFRGVLAQQLVANDINAIVAKSLDGLSGLEILVHIGAGNLALSYPSLEQDAVDKGKYKYISEYIIANGQSAGLVEVPTSKALIKSLYVGYASSKKFDIETMVTLPKENLIAEFIRQNLALLISMIFVLLALTGIIWRFYRNAIEIEMTLEISYSDPLTQLKNRRAFDLEFPRVWKVSMRTKQAISALFIDIDHFKIFNDQYGHECGDTALKAVADAIQACVSRPLDICCRWGGEEFAVVLPDTSEQDAILLAKKIMQAVREIHFNFSCEVQPKITVSIGIASIVVTEENQTDDLIDMADKAMYQAKQSGRNRYALYSDHNSHENS
jgi:diguanylate cyclase (GGDEF)-like protein